jgi:hypothetical protein
MIDGALCQPRAAAYAIDAQSLTGIPFADLPSTPCEPHMRSAST